MKAFRILSMVAMALILGACDNEDNNIEQPVQQTKSIPFSATIAAPNSGAKTRTIYNEDNGQINVAWDVDDEIALLHNGVKDVATVTAVDGSGNATISATLTGNPTDGDAVQLVYPASSINADGTPTTEAQSAQLNQDGTLAYIQNNLDGRQGAGQLSIPVSGNASFKANVTMASSIAIWKLTLQDEGSNTINANSVALTIGTTPVAAAAAASAKSGWYICYPVAAIQSLTGDFTISASAASGSYTYTKAGGVTLLPSHYYQSTVTMAAPAPKAAADATTDDVGKLIGADGKIYADAAAATAANTYAVAMIAYVGNESDCEHGLAIALNDESNDGMVYSEALTSFSSRAIVTGGTWRLPSFKDWQYMLFGCGASGSYADYNDYADDVDYTNLFAKLNTIGGTAPLKEDYYWTRTDGSYGDTKLVLYFHDDYAESGETTTNDPDNFVRVCLAF